MLLLGLEPTIPASERTKTVHTLDRWATVTGSVQCSFVQFPTAVFTKITVFWDVTSRNLVVGYV
jgi:hypothetical protein